MSNIRDFLENAGLYVEVEFSPSDFDDMIFYFSQQLYERPIKCYCRDCDESLIFYSETVEACDTVRTKMIPTGAIVSMGAGRSADEATANMLKRRYCLQFRCSQDKSHKLLFDILVLDGKIVKIGQYPSYADISAGEIKKYKPLLKGQLFFDFRRAIGLYANGIGIGSYVYLRRILENLVLSKYTQHKNDISATEEEFGLHHFDEKIKDLEGFLPNSLVQRRSLYGIISMGIHELDEEKCREMFPIIRTGIELILDEELASREREMKEKEVDRLVSNMATGKSSGIEKMG